ncbi:hypothetical protein EV424DRAFT_1540174 [Suillus variegatus]|nr:hypothetical protein EV424DRAFT_1540174 [Suillus variegatus]
MSDTVKAIPLFYGDYGENENPSAWFAQFELSLPMNWTDMQRVQRFGMQLTPGEAAEEWYQSLTSKQLSSFADLKLVFFKRWPHPKCPKLTRAQERIMAQVLKEEEVGEWTQVGRTGNYAHVIWAINISKLALGMGDVNGAMIEYALEGIPNVLKDHLECAYTTWEEFVEDIQKVPNVKLKRSREDLEKNRARDAEIAKLKAQNSPSPLLLSQQFAQMSIPAQQTVPTSYRLTPRMFNPNMSTSTFPPVTTQPMFNVGPFMTPRNGPPVYNGTRGAFPPRTPLTRAQILERTALVPQRPNTEAGMRQYEGDVDLWHRTYGTDGMTTLDRPYPLRPGTALVGSGECYNCGMVMEPTHLSSQCTTSSPLHPHETKWRQQVAGMLRRAMLQQGARSSYGTPVQYVTPTNQPLYQSYGNHYMQPVYHITPQEEQSWGEQNDAWGMQEPGYE